MKASGGHSRFTGGRKRFLIVARYGATIRSFSLPGSGSESKAMKNLVFPR
jgi:hypothetical protein